MNGPLRLPCAASLSVCLLFLTILPGLHAAEKPNPFDRGKPLPEKVGDMLDANKDGVITDAETRRAVAELQKRAREKDERAKAIMDAFDQNQDGLLDGPEASDAAARARIAADGIGRVVAEIFSNVDADADALVTQLEFAAVVKKLGVLGELMKPRLVELFLRMDADRDGVISVPESQMAADYFAKQAQMKAELRKAQQKQKIYQISQQVMTRLDGNRNGRISKREAKRDPQVSAVFEQVDTDMDNQISAEEAYRYIERKMGG